MGVSEVLMGLGSWSVTLAEATPREVLDRLGYFGHLAVIPGRVSPAQYGDTLLTMARYVGVLTSRDFAAAKTISGQGMAVWLGDADDKGEVLESPVVINGQTFANSIRTLLGSSTAVVEGTFYSVAGTYTGRHRWESRRKAIDYVCQTMGAEWRVNGNATLDAGTITNLYVTTPTCVIVRDGAGRDLTLTGLPGDIELTRDVEDWTSRVVLLAEGEGDAVATGSANIGPNPYLDLRGQAVKRTRLISESGTVTGNATARAQLQLNRFSGTRNAVRLSTADYEVRGSFQVGDYVWVYDPDAGLFDTTSEITFRGQRLNPVKLRVVETAWPITTGMTVAYRHQDGTWVDLTNFMAWESGATSITVGELTRALTSSGLEPVGSRPIPDSTIPGPVTFSTPFGTSVYLDALGNTLARILVSWSLPLNSDGLTIVDGDHYEIRYGVNPASSWQTAYAPWGDLSAMISELSPGVTYDFQIRAVDTAAHTGPWSATTSAVANPDTIAPSTPAPPTVAASRIAFQITHTLGAAAGGTYNLEKDLDHLEVHVGPSSGFTPDASTLRGTVSANAGMMQAQIPAVGTVTVDETTAMFVKVIAVDEAGNKSSPSAAASSTALLIDNAHISDLTVSKLTAGTLAADITVSARIKTANTGARVELNASGLQAFNAGGTQTVNVAAADGSVSIVGQLASGATGRRVVVSPAGATDPELRFYSGNGTSFARIYAVPTSTTEPELNFVGAVGANGSKPSFFLGSGFSDWLLDNAGSTPDCRIRLQANGDVGITSGAFRYNGPGVAELVSTAGDVVLDAAGQASVTATGDLNLVSESGTVAVRGNYWKYDPDGAFTGGRVNIDGFSSQTIGYGVTYETTMNTLCSLKRTSIVAWIMTLSTASSFAFTSASAGGPTDFINYIGTRGT